MLSVYLKQTPNTLDMLDTLAHVLYSFSSSTVELVLVPCQRKEVDQ